MSIQSGIFYCIVLQAVGSVPRLEAAAQRPVTLRERVISELCAGCVVIEMANVHTARDEMAFARDVS